MRSVAHLPSCNHASFWISRVETPPSPISPAFSGQCLSLAAPVCNWIYWVESPQVLSHIAYRATIWRSYSNMRRGSTLQTGPTKTGHSGWHSIQPPSKRACCSKIMYWMLCTVLETKSRWYTDIVSCLILQTNEIVHWCQLELLPRVFSAALSNMDARKNQTETRHSIGPILLIVPTKTKWSRYVSFTGQKGKILHIMMRNEQDIFPKIHQPKWYLSTWRLMWVKNKIGYILSS